jgi:hypothetical protein
MTTSRKRRIVKRLAVTLAVAMLLLAWYVSSWALLPRFAEAGGFSQETYFSLEAIVYAPINWYCSAGLPGTDLLYDLWYKANPPHSGPRIDP